MGLPLPLLDNNVQGAEGSTGDASLLVVTEGGMEVVGSAFLLKPFFI